MFITSEAIKILTRKLTFHHHHHRLVDCKHIVQRGRKKLWHRKVEDIKLKLYVHFIHYAIMVIIQTRNKKNYIRHKKTKRKLPRCVKWQYNI